MKARRWKQAPPLPPPGDDNVPTPPPVDEDPPHDRYCDLILTGGVASGVVYPWAIVELARAYRFRSIGGTSVGAMAAALAAAAEYGRRTGARAPFETLRRLPGALGEDLPEGRTRMYSLFQTNEDGKRLIELWRRLGRGEAPRAPENSYPDTADEADEADEADAANRTPDWMRREKPLPFRRIATELPIVYIAPCVRGALVGALIGVLVGVLTAVVSALLLRCCVPLQCLPVQRADSCAATLTAAPLVPLLVLMLLLSLVGAAFGLVRALWSDIRHGVIENDFGLCKGGTIAGLGPDGLRRPAITEWLHDGIQLSAGLERSDPPLTFRDLWSAPAYPGAEQRPCGIDDPPRQRAIDLQMVTTNITHGRPYRLPMTDRSSRLFFRPDELEDYFPAIVLEALKRASRPYEPASHADPSTSDVPPGFLELPDVDLPIVVAARLSLSFPFLFSGVPLWAIDYEAPPTERTLRKCRFSDGGASSNFPIHLFDATLPAWPTFGLWLGRRVPYCYPNRDRPRVQVAGDDGEEDYWLPEFNAQGMGDNWLRFEPDARAPPPGAGQPAAADARPCVRSSLGALSDLAGFVKAIATSAVEWRDRTALRMPHVRNRVMRLLLRPGEGGLNIGMPRRQILSMAHRYGTRPGREFVERFADRSGKPSPAWREQRWLRMELLIQGLRERLARLSVNAAWSARTVPMRQAIQEATLNGPVRDRYDNPALEAEQARTLMDMLSELERVELALATADARLRRRVPMPELRMRPPL